MPIQLAQCWFPGLDISNAKISKYFSAVAANFKLRCYRKYRVKAIPLTLLARIVCDSPSVCLSQHSVAAAAGLLLWAPRRSDIDRFL